jgi:WhiB family transcriptional regulator, redox-sensing transcriptional regulator
MEPLDSWGERGACRDHDDKADFWPEDYHGHDARAREQRAIEVCNRCHVKTACLQWAIVGERWGVWGGTTGRERAELRRLAGRKVHIDYPSPRKPDAPTKDPQPTPTRLGTLPQLSRIPAFTRKA